MRSFKILFLFSIPFIILFSMSSCGGNVYDDNYTLSTDGVYGYLTKYYGASEQAYFNSWSTSEEIARELVKAINLGNKIYINAAEILVPDLFIDNISEYYYEGGFIVDNGTCGDYEATRGTREYLYQIISPTGAIDNASFTNYVYFNNYCIRNNYSAVQRDVKVNNRAELEQYIKQNSFTRAITSILRADGIDNITLKIQNNSTSWDNFTFNGRIDRYKLKQLEGSTYSKNTTTISMDMPENPTNYRFDLMADEGNTTTKPTKTINFYHHTYGYVTADISFLGNNEEVTDMQVITMKFRDGTCDFYPAKIDSGCFDCNSDTESCGW